MRAISEMSGFAIEGSPPRAKSPWQRLRVSAEGVLEHFVQQKPRQKSGGSGPWGAATITPVPPVWPEPCLLPNGHDSVGEDAWGTLVTSV